MTIDLTTVGIIFVAGLIAIGLSVWMLNRAWGNFPSRSAMPPPPSFISTADRLPEVHSQEEERSLPAGAPSDSLVAIQHPLVLRTVLQALEKPGSPYATYFLRDGDRVFLVLSRIADPALRETARRMFTGLSGDTMEGLDIGAMIQVLHQLGKR